MRPTPLPGERFSQASLGFIAVFAAISHLIATASGFADGINWNGSIEVATGAGQRGSWQQNESRYDYVDDPAVALYPGGDAAVAWVDQRQKDVLFQIYDRSGKPRATQPINVSRSPAIFSWLPRVAVSPADASELYVLWQEIVFSGGSHGGEIFFARSADRGASFRDPVNLSNSVAGDGKGRINKDVWHNGSLDLAVGSDGTLYAIWTEYDGPLWLSRSHNRGETFSKPLRIAGGGQAKPARAPTLAVGSDNSIYLAWTVGEETGADIRVMNSRDNGRTFGEPILVEKTRGYSDAPKLIVDRRGTVHIVYAESSGGPFDRYHVRYTRSRDGGRTFNEAREISRAIRDSIESAAFPALSLDGHDDLYVVWEVYPNQRDHPRGLAISCSRDGGDTFSAPALVPGSIDPHDGWNGSNQGLLMRKLAVNRAGDIAVVNSSFKENVESRVWLMRGQLRD